MGRSSRRRESYCRKTALLDPFGSDAGLLIQYASGLSFARRNRLWRCKMPHDSIRHDNCLGDWHECWTIASDLPLSNLR